MMPNRPNPERSLELIEIAARAMYQVDQGVPWAFESTEALSDYKAMAVAALEAIVNATELQGEPSDAQVLAGAIALTGGSAILFAELDTETQDRYLEDAHAALVAAGDVR